MQDRMEGRPPDLRLSGLSIWIDGREFAHSADYWDGNWLRVRVRMQASGASVGCEGSILRTSDVERFRDELASASANLSGEATLSSLEPDLKVSLKMLHLGHIAGEVEITPDYLNQFHRFDIELDQTYLPELIASCEAILEKYPVVGTP